MRQSTVTNVLAARVLALGEAAILVVGGTLATSVGLTSPIIGGTSLQVGIPILVLAVVTRVCAAFLRQRIIQWLCVAGAVAGSVILVIDAAYVQLPASWALATAGVILAVALAVALGIRRKA